MTDTQQPWPLMIVLVRGPLLEDLEVGPQNEPILRIPITSTMSPLAGIGTTLVTGASPQSHGIVTAQIPDETGQMRAVVASDRHFPAFWTRNDAIKTILIDWPAIEGDPDLAPDDCLIPTQTDPLDRLQESLDLMASAVDRPWSTIGVALHATGRSEIADEASCLAGSELLALLEQAPDRTTMLILHAPTNDHPGTSMTLIGGPQEPTEPPLSTTLTAVGGLIRRLVNADCPQGVNFNHISGVSLPPVPTRSLPAYATTDQTDWDLVIMRVMERDDQMATTLLVRRFHAMADFALRRRNWDLLLQHTSRLCRLRSEPLDHWQRMLSAERLNNMDALQEAIECAEMAHPEHPNAAMGYAILAVRTKAEDARDRLSAINLDDMTWPTAAGCYGRLCIQCGMATEGMAALQKAVRLDNVLAIDRLALAEALIDHGDAEAALQAMGDKGKPQDPLRWGIVRLKAMLVMDHPKASSWAESLRTAHPASRSAIDSVMQAGQRESHD